MTKTLFLKEVSLFNGLPDQDLERIVNIAKEQTFRWHEVVFHAGDPGNALFILKTGLVKISIHDEKGNEDILRLLYPYEFFGEMSLLDGQYRPATVTALEKSSAIIIERDPFLELMGKCPDISMKMLTTLSRRLRKTFEKVGSLRFSTSYARVARVLLDIAEDKGSREEYGIVINMDMSRQTIASMAGLTRETASRILKEFMDCGCLRVENKRMIITKEAVLKREMTRVKSPKSF